MQLGSTFARLVFGGEPSPRAPGIPRLATPTCASLATIVGVLAVAACQPRQDDMPPGYPGYGPSQPPAGYATGTAPPGYPPGYPPAATAPPMGMPPPGPTGSGTMAVPGPIAFQCKDDVPCGTHHCNLQYGKCAFPCQSATDCIPPNSCVAGLCVPAPPQPH
jgi:hypothetical protein